MGMASVKPLPYPFDLQQPPNLMSASPKPGRESFSKTIRPKRKAFLIAVKEQREATRVYAVLARSSDDALVLLQEQTGEGTALKLVGTLSGRIARSLNLEPDELRLV
jgi:hypothetical protein